MNLLNEHKLYCPYCGELITVLIDASVHEQDYIEDCEVCCRPISFVVHIDTDGDTQVIAQHENDAGY